MKYKRFYYKLVVSLFVVSNIWLIYYYRKFQNVEEFNVRDQLLDPLMQKLEMLQKVQAETEEEIQRKEQKLAELYDLINETQQNKFLDTRTKSLIQTENLSNLFFQARPNRFFGLTEFKPYQQPL